MRERVYLNGDFVARDEARVSIDDRGFLFADAVYEVIPAYGGRAFRFADHMRRLGASLRAIGMELPDDAQRWDRVTRELLAQRPDSEQYIYLQVTRGAGNGRDVAALDGLRPTVLISASAVDPARSRPRNGVRVVLLEDIRWGRCDIKCTSLLGNVLLRREASLRGGAEALLHRDGELTEGASSNAFFVIDGVLRTAPADQRILHGITREVVIELALQSRIALEQRAVALTELDAVTEAFICSSVREVVPVTAIDERPLGDGRPGAVTTGIIAAFDAMKACWKGEAA